MKAKFRKPVNPLFKPQDRYYVNERGWWFYTVDMISGPYATKAECVDACRSYIQKRDGVFAETC
ncbi:hypothetical protein Q9L42_002245 [Methylomarinum sp. Ch1-1]|uniref:DUF1508 domain-containing protein n=1 Tax=Methylomarinum roseum TaxID=3067653 RepID=A0AAU7NVH2_9GAMM|nr:hypothetical protein [Methylomarinum sp. Ch1-1]MDP4523004.1 hypothetical protein [Methylomarinum sp. Ch1-1]